MNFFIGNELLLNLLYTNQEFYQQNFDYLKGFQTVSDTSQKKKQKKHKSIAISFSIREGNILSQHSWYKDHRIIKMYQGKFSFETKNG